MQKGFAPILVILGIALVLSIAAGAYYLGIQKNSDGQVVDQQNNESPVASELKYKDSTTTSDLVQQSPAPSSSQIPVKNLKKIPLLVDTNGWKEVVLNGVIFKIPSEFKVENDEFPYRGQGILFYFNNGIIPSRITVEDYNGGSRREQFWGSFKDTTCGDIYEEALFGEVEALQIAIDGGACQGGGGGIVAVISNKLVIYHNLYYDLKTKEITRASIRDTIISTLRKEI